LRDLQFHDLNLPLFDGPGGPPVSTHLDS
jgi:hypothetical protein